jgi:serine/threonine protein kinase
MPAPASVPEFLDLVRRSQLLPDCKVDDFMDRHRLSGTMPTTVDQVANLLVREAQITFFQAKQLKLGRYKRFTIGSKYRLLELIGAGGMGAVYLCDHTLMRRLVALKVLPVEKLEDESNKERFYREARAVAALDHPNIVRAYDIDTYEKLHFLVMEYVDGTSLQEVVARYVLDKKLFDPTRAAHYMAQSAIGMQHAHELGMVHRDIKPGNLLLDRTGMIKVLDMGLARFFNKQQDSVTEKYDQNCVLGTADYLAPEQAVSNMVDIRADIYALGGTFYFMLTGQTPFPDGTIAAKLVAHQTREPRPVESFRSDVPPGLLAVLRKMMAKQPDDRYQTPMEVADALEEWADLPVTPPPAREMPIHCPLVQALAGTPLSGSGSGSPLARALFGPGAGVFARSGSGGASRSGSKILSGSAANFPALNGTGSTPSFSRSDAHIPFGGPVSTTRASSAPTAPLQHPNHRQSDNGALPPPSTSLTVHQSRPRRKIIYALVVILLTLFFVASSVAAYYIGKGGKKDPPASSTAPTTATTPASAGTTEDGFTPGPADKLLTPAQAQDQDKVSEIQTVEFRVLSFTNSGYLALNSEASVGAKNLGVRISSSYFKLAGGQEALLRKDTENDYRGKLIRARGKLYRDELNQSTFLEVRSPKQILVVTDDH